MAAAFRCARFTGETQRTQRRVRIVLVRPRNPLNIGAIARVMANFGFSDLVVVDPHPPVWKETCETALRAAPGGDAVIAAARNLPALTEAIEGCTLVIGTTSGADRALDREPIGPSSLPAMISKSRGRVALVFGSERTGLSKEDFSHCHRLLRIPTTLETPSMNLAQSVTVCCYEMVRKPARKLAEVKRPPVEHLMRLLGIVAPILEASRFFDEGTRPARMRKLRQILLRAGLSPLDLALLTTAARKVEHKIKP